MTKHAPLLFGVIEGFFGKPWSDAARRANLHFLRPLGFGYYIYAPKADRYLRRRWRDPLPTEELTQLMTLAAWCRANGVRFGIGLTPYELHLDYSPDAKAALQRKIAQLDRIGIDILCILFDDMRGGPRLAELQARVVADITGWSAATAFIVCPTYYSDDPVLGQVFGPVPKNYLQDLGHNLDPAVDVFWTGKKVCSLGYPDPHLEEVAGRLGRKPFIWDNSLANDGKARCSHLYLDPWSNGWSLNTQLLAGLAINPMNQPHLSRIPLTAIASWLADPAIRQVNITLESQVRSVCGSVLGAEIFGDLDLFQNQGLSELDDRARELLIDKYRRFESDGCAREIGDWLRGEYNFDPHCLTADS
jgi:hyaluronoglucosaminidase